MCFKSGRDLFATATSDIGGGPRESDGDTPGKLHMLAEFRNTDLSSDEIRDELVTVVVAGVRASGNGGSTSAHGLGGPSAIHNLV